ncbi:MAG TPA: hypothetical protein VH704_10670 [Casimicrobiaceae bacterium]|nr:hypothetical protein [Casimicrobiaceae bacterium]
MLPSSRWLTMVALALVATAARAEFHTFQIEQMYSNADGSVQFVVLHESQGMDGENFLQGQALTSTHMGVTKTYIFPANLPGGNMCDGYYGCNPSPTANSHVLIATPGFAALNLVAPNYVIPSGFLPTDGGTLNYAFVDQVTFASLPTDGVNALTRSGTIVPNVATNFVGYSASVAGPGGINYQGLWFNPAESGWGINFAHDGDTIFASWFTYDMTGKGTWLVMTATKTGPNTYTGTLVQGTGPAFDAVPFPPLGSPGGATVSGLGGPATLMFTDANNALFTYTVNGITQTKAITRQVLAAAPLPVCTFGGQPNLALATNYTALWWAAPPGSEAGWGVNLTHQGDLIFVTWFTFAHDHTPMWLVGTASKTSPGVYTITQLGRLTGPPFSATPFPPLGTPGGPVVAVAGSATLTFTDGNTATFNYTVDGVTQTKTITRQVLQNPGTVCQ